MKTKKKEPATVDVRKDPMIRFIDMPGKKVMVIDLINFLTEEQMTAKYDEDTTKVYKGADSFVFLMYRPDGRKYLVLSSLIPEVPMCIDIGDCYDRKLFGKIISEIKKCGKLLHDIAEAMDKNPVKAIVI